MECSLTTSRISVFGFKLWVVAIAGAALLGVFISIGVYIRNSEQAKATVITQAGEIKDLKDGKAKAEEETRKESKATQACLDANKNNAAEAKRIADQNVKGDENSRVIGRLADDEIGDKKRESEKFKDRQLSCPALDVELRQWLLDSTGSS